MSISIFVAGFFLIAYMILMVYMLCFLFTL